MDSGGWEVVESKRNRKGAAKAVARPEPSPLVRRMDSLARVLDIGGTTVTAVGFDRGNARMLVAANAHPGGTERYNPRLGTRIEALQSFVNTDFGDDRHAARVGAERVRREIGTTFSDTRFVRDLLKLRRSLRGEYGPESGRNFSEAQRAAILGDQWLLHKRGDDVHAELDVARRSEPGPLGVSKLSCRDCHDYIVRNRNDVELRGTHGHGFRGWKDPTSRENAELRASEGHLAPARQHPDDSDSDVE